MPIDSPDATNADIDDSRVRFRRSARFAVAFVALLWIVGLLQCMFGVDAGVFGVRPREIPGLVGILLAPLLHSGFEHLLANSLPLLVVGTATLYLYPHSAWLLVPAVYVGPGIAVWMFGRSAVHIGASGLVYGLVAYVFVSGVLRRDRRAIAASLLVSFLYGALIWGVFPLRSGMSWETHLSAALLGVGLAFVFRHRDVPPPRRYSWEDEPDDDVAPPLVPTLPGKAAGSE